MGRPPSINMENEVLANLVWKRVAGGWGGCSPSGASFWYPTRSDRYLAPWNTYINDFMRFVLRRDLGASWTGGPRTGIGARELPTNHGAQRGGCEAKSVCARRHPLSPPPTPHPPPTTTHPLTCTASSRGAYVHSVPTLPGRRKSGTEEATQGRASFVSSPHPRQVRVVKSTWSIKARLAGDSLCRTRKRNSWASC